MGEIVPFRFPRKFAFLGRPSRYKVGWGGRGSGKSFNFAQAIVGLAYSRKLRVLCAREYQTSIADSVHALLKSRIEKSGLSEFFDVGRNYITSSVGSEIMFDGLHQNVDQIKSKHEIDLCWVEEAHRVEDESWKYLIPTIREDAPAGPFGTGSEIWISYNQHDDTDATHKRFVLETPPDAQVVPLTWEDNPHFPDVLDAERRYMLENDPSAYDWVWGLECRRIGSSVVFKDRYEIRNFETHEGVQFLFGADFGFAADPSTLVRCYVWDDCLWIDHEWFGYGVEFEEMPAAYDTVPKSREWPIKGDAARPETISYLRRKQFQIRAALKWQGSVEDGIAHLKGFRKIYIHERCTRMAQEARLYSYKTDRVSGDVLPVLVDKHNHGWDAVRYALDGFITRRGSLAMWEKLGAA